ncbi:MAG: 16S rRNA (adenine(1518)-N(6)/adenine(1519)-N(6))-dimethyltransferase RsmA [Candidatus Eremiobacteraeota bacterium]|nr:16S rRNA (adenine(1518)-N(6)/adenine(1519)-N(6))-dimethyltransferase RsmA [Candidatus Eremiobacteraeota bacterium]
MLAARGLRPKKRFGQNFLTDGAALRRIADLCVTQHGARVIEIGAGTGALTGALLERGARLTALEIDSDLVAILRERDDLAGAEIAQGDALGFDYDAATADGPWCGAGNMPYNIATPLIGQWLGLRNPPQRIVAMLQRDVAERLTARPGTPQYGSLTLVVTYAMTVRRMFVLGPAAFYPRPAVDSAVVLMERRPVPAVTVREPAFLLQVVRGAFAYRRKTLANSLTLALGIARARTQSALAALDIDTEIRAEQLDLGAFGALADRLGD